jgi:hypothetical protein
LRANEKKIESGIKDRISESGHEERDKEYDKINIEEFEAQLVKQLVEKKKKKGVKTIEKILKSEEPYVPDLTAIPKGKLERYKSKYFYASITTYFLPP